MSATVVVRGRSVSVEWHAVGLHAHLLLHVGKYFLVCLAAFFCLAGDEVEVL